jgi:hypothetical protein
VIASGKDRGEQPYRVLVDRRTGAAMLISPTRRMRKALHLSGRQFKKEYKAANREAKARQRAALAPDHSTKAGQNENGSDE